MLPALAIILGCRLWLPLSSTSPSYPPQLSAQCCQNGLAYNHGLQPWWQTSAIIPSSKPQLTILYCANPCYHLDLSSVFYSSCFSAVSNFSLSQHRVFRSVAINSSDCDVHLDRIHLSLSRWHVTPRNWTFFERLIRNVDIYFVSNSKEQQLKPKFYQSSDIFGDKEKENIGFALLYNLFQYILV